jgi:hypothetical protein
VTLAAIAVGLKSRLAHPSRRWLALLWALATLLAAAATAPAVGVSRDEGVYFVAAESYARFNPARSATREQLAVAIDRSFSVNHEHPALAKEIDGLTHAALTQWLGVASHAQGFRFGAFLFAALLSWVLVLFAWDLAGAGAALLAPALFWLVPRHFYHAHPAVLDMPVTALWLATVYAYWKSRSPERSRAHAVGSALAAGLLFGAAISVKLNGWFLPPLLFAHWLASALLEHRRTPAPERSPKVPLAFVCMALLGPLVLVATWPWLWVHPLGRLREYALFHLQHENYPWHYLGTVLRNPPFPIAYPFVVTALTVPAAILAAMAGGLAQAAARLAAGIRKRAPEISISDELLLLLSALFPMCLVAWPTVPHFGGVKHWMPAMPFLALLAARALVTAGRILWPERRRSVTAALAFFALAPALWAVAHDHPFGTAAYNEIAGGAPGAASLGMQRQFWGDNMVAALAALNEHAVPEARIWYQEAAPTAVRAYQRDGRLRPDLRWVDGPETADISVYHYHQEFRDKEFATWTLFHSARPVYGVYLDEVPLIQVYARAGAWR